MITREVSNVGGVKTMKNAYRYEVSRVAKFCTLVAFSAAAVLAIFNTDAEARELQYSGGGEEQVYVRSGEPTEIHFPGKIKGGFKKKDSALALDKQEDFLVVFAKQELPLEGEAILVHLQDKRTYALRVLPATDPSQKDVSVKVVDPREPEIEEEDPAAALPKGEGIKFAPPSSISGLMREMVLMAEFGKKKNPPGYRRSNKYSGETVLDDGTLVATVDEIFMGSNYWGYVLNVENKLETTNRINPATFRIDGTRAVVAERWELAPRPLTEEQRIAKGHRGKVYVVTRSKRK